MNIPALKVFIRDLSLHPTAVSISILKWSGLRTVLVLALLRLPPRHMSLARPILSRITVRLSSLPVLLTALMLIFQQLVIVVLVRCPRVRVRGQGVRVCMLYDRPTRGGISGISGEVLRCRGFVPDVREGRGLAGIHV